MPAMPGPASAGTCRPRCVLEHRHQAQHHQSLAESPAGLGGADRAGAGEGAGLGRASLPHRQEPLRHKKLRYRGLAKNTAQLRTLFPGQPGDRQESPVRANASVITPESASIRQTTQKNASTTPISATSDPSKRRAARSQNNSSAARPPITRIAQCLLSAHHAANPWRRPFLTWCPPAPLPYRHYTLKTLFPCPSEQAPLERPAPTNEILFGHHEAESYPPASSKSTAGVALSKRTGRFCAGLCGGHATDRRSNSAMVSYS